MVSWIIPIVRQWKTDLIHRQVMRPLRHGGSRVVKWLPPWLPDDWYYPWNRGRTYDLSSDFFQQLYIYIYIERESGQHLTVNTIWICIALYDGWPSTQPDWIAHNLAGHHGTAHSPVAWWCAGSVMCVTAMDNPLHSLTSQRAIKVGLTLPQRRDDSTTLRQRWAHLHCCLANYTQPSQHTTKPPGFVQLGDVLLGCVQCG